MAEQSSNRRWDDPPEEEEPTATPDTKTTLTFVDTFTMRSPYSANEIRHLCFTPSGSHLLAAVGKGDAKLALALWSADKGTAMPRNNAAVGGKAGGFALMPMAGPGAIVACPYR
ncbi:hypothetical protein N656DRAFT_648203 [Canariomyces notabilis]|uniref:Uncharacterized protein n=1 Tax=Canariomyces notabilis TaxID=2074819 RepID=A0AAN6YSY8_9PEZI|nr:hypothetical protein N656DRAFT_648203 [Canariomyces arenarius]